MRSFPLSSALGLPVADTTREFAHTAWSLLVLSSLVVFAACGRDSAGSASSDVAIATDSAGVQMLALSATDRPFPDSLVEVQRITPADSGMGAFVGAWSGSVASNGVDRLYVLARDDAQIVVFDDQGVALERWGRRGGGPGELEFPDGLLVNDDGSVEVYDFTRTAFVRFAADGAVLPLRPLPRDSMGSPNSTGRAAGESFVFSRRRQANDSSTTDYVLTTATDTTLLASLTVKVTPDVAFETCPVRLSGMEPYFSPTMNVARAPDRWAVLKGPTWRVEWYDGARLASVWTRPSEAPRPSSLALLEQELAQGFQLRFGSESCKVPTSEVATAIGMAQTHPALRRIAVAPDGTVWAERYEPQTATQRVDVIAPDGRYRGTIEGRGAPMAFLQGGRVVYSEEDELTGIVELVVLRVSGAGW